jgi:hypothetical protein
MAVADLPPEVCEEFAMTTRPVGSSETVTATRPPSSRVDRVIRVGCVAAVAAGVLMVVQGVWEEVIPGIQIGAGWSALHTSWLALMFLANLGLVALQRPALDRFGRFAAALVLVGAGAQTIVALLETVSLVADPAPRTGDPAPPVLAAILTVYALYVVGGLLFNVATFRARVLPRLAVVAVLVAMLLKMFASGVIPATLALGGVAFAGLGVTAIRAYRNRLSS